MAGTGLHLLPGAVFPTLVTAPARFSRSLLSFPAAGVAAARHSRRASRHKAPGPPTSHRAALTVAGWRPTGGKAVGGPGTHQDAAGDRR